MMVLGLLLIVCVLFLPDGIATLWQKKGADRG
jgi:branched-chain amino acid transport system permease protein